MEGTKESAITDVRFPVSLSTFLSIMCLLFFLCVNINVRDPTRQCKCVKQFPCSAYMCESVALNTFVITC